MEYCKICRKETKCVNDHKQAIKICTNCGTVLKTMIQSDNLSFKECFSESSSVNKSMSDRLGSVIPESSKGLSKLNRQINKKFRQSKMSNSNGHKKNIEKLENMIQNMWVQLGYETYSRFYYCSIYFLNKIINMKGRQIKKGELLCILTIILTCRKHRIAFTFNHLSSICKNVSKKEICKCYKRYKHFVDTENNFNVKELIPYFLKDTSFERRTLHKLTKCGIKLFNIVSKKKNNKSYIICCCIFLLYTHI